MSNLIKTITLILFFAISNNYAQIVQDWVQRWDGGNNSEDGAMAIVMDNSGNSYVTGYCTSQNSIVTIKYDINGVQQWLAQYGSTDDPIGQLPSTGYSIALGRDPNNPDPNNRLIYVTGTKLSLTHGYDFITICYNANGTIHSGWPQFYDGPINGDDIAYKIVVDNLGCPFVTGKSRGNDGSYDFATVKYNINGTQLWAQRYAGSAGRYDAAFGMALGGSIAPVYVSGLSFVGLHNQYNLVTIGYDDNGSQLWISTYPSADPDTTLPQNRNIVVADYTQGVYVTGYSSGNFVTLKLAIGDGSVIWNRAVTGGAGKSIGIFQKFIGKTWWHTNDVFVAGVIGSQYGIIKYDDNGNQQWVQQYYNNGQANYLAIDQNENVYVTGSYGSGTASNYGTVKYTSAGVLNGEQHYDNGGYDVAYGIDVYNTTGGALAGVTGVSYGGGSTLDDYATVQYASQYGGTTLQNPNGQENNTNAIPSTYSLSQNYPNPFNPTTMIKFGLPKDGFVSIKVFDILGREIATIVNENKPAGYYEVNFDASKLSSGMYFYKIQSGNFIDVKKMMLVK